MPRKPKRCPSTLTSTYLTARLFQRTIPTIGLVALFALASPCMSAQAEQMASVTIERVAEKQWRATFRLNAPTTSLRFDRAAAFYRERVWQISTPDYRFARQGDQQYVTLDSGAVPKRDIVFEFPEFTEGLPKEYELFLGFTDGAVAVFTGHFRALAIGTEAADSSRVRHIRITAPPGAHAIVEGRVRDGVVAVTDSLGGTYVYLGRAEPIETPDIVAVIDPGMPRWLKEAFDRDLPALFHEYARRLDASLPFKPMVYYSFDEAGRGRSAAGGALTGLLNITLTGSGWRTQTPAAAEQAFWLMAHESVHLWNGRLVRNVDDTGSWMHEGSADAMAGEMLLALGVIDAARYRELRNEAFNKCVSAVSGGSVETALQRGEVQTVYDCGVVLSVWTEAAVRKLKPDADLFSFWRALIADSRDRGAYDERSYFSTLAAFGVSDRTIARMRSFLNSRDSAAVATVIAGLEAAGIGVRAAQGEPPPAYQRDLVRSAMTHLMEHACGSIDFTSGSPLHTGAVAGCAPFAREMQVYRIQGFRVRDQGAALYDAVRSACHANEGVALQGDGGATLVTVPCTKVLPASTAWYQLGGMSP